MSKDIEHEMHLFLLKIVNMYKEILVHLAFTLCSKVHCGKGYMYWKFYKIQSRNFNFGLLVTMQTLSSIENVGSVKVQSIWSPEDLIRSL